ncbi:DUF2202 domain-containing protein [Lewinella sp. W8]|uniref:DUF2202 domain-containing protein n=1 Tax=Lewinella sp. W8 TaxID=2528208 RepID=UPI0010679F6D|nr:DUF2202 domain-containing protein [Lewinella sp. W8]MTB52013.1 DUF2202 domain-containing protein [Lewinella sp. W8]
MSDLKVIPIFFILVLGAFSFSACEKADPITTTENLALTAGEQALLQYMWEEEKLARDVYSYLAGLYDTNVFPNISGSEQSHMDLTLEVMVQYNVVNLGSNDVGVFTDPALQDLYDALTAQGATSIIEALKVGATIEDVDIFDLRAAKSQTDNPDLISLFNLLECGSGNHMRAFTAKLSGYDVTYSPQYISTPDYEAILAGEHMRCG